MRNSAKKNRITGKGIAATALAALGTLFLTACLALSAFGRLAADGETYFEVQRAQNVDAGISQEEMLRLDMLLADYLAGNEGALDETDAFNEREKAHMLDVYAIFEAMREISRACLVTGCLFMAAALMFPGNRVKRAWAGAALGAVMFFLPLAACAVWAAADFTSAFNAMHHALFDNDLWLLDPRTDLMIRMLPQRFFMALAGYLAAGTGLAAAVAPVICGVFAAVVAKIAPARWLDKR